MPKRKYTSDPAGILVFPFQDENWLKKTGIAFLLVVLGFIPVIPTVLLLGYMAEIIKRVVVQREEPSLPEWDDFSAYFNAGFRLFGAGAVYLLPSTLLFGVGYLGMLLPVVFMDNVGYMESGGGIFVIAGYLMGLVLMGFAALISIITSMALPVAAVHLAVKEDFKAAFKVKEIWSIARANWKGFLLAYLLLVGASVILYYGTYFLVATVILCCLYPFAFSFIIAYLGLIAAGLYGDAYKTGLENLPVGK
ncbi:MAG: DUF4013 domain-containing protein [Chloroflexi bacterium]|nr:DUF4013 domain-containing protein [Chloroflexota bacterium]